MTVNRHSPADSIRRYSTGRSGGNRYASSNAQLLDALNRTVGLMTDPQKAHGPDSVPVWKNYPKILQSSAYRKSQTSDKRMLMLALIHLPGVLPIHLQLPPVLLQVFPHACFRLPARLSR